VSVTVRDVQAFRDRNERFVMLTAYDALSAKLLDDAGIPLILVGDSVGGILGYDSTLPVTMEDMLHHTASVVRGTTNAFVIGDMPFMSYQASVEDGVRNAGRLIKEAGAHAVKLEGGRRAVDLVTKLTDAGIPVMAHLGLTPQSVNQFGGYRVQGRDHEDAYRMVEDAKSLEAAGAFTLVLEAVPASLAKEVTDSLHIPTIGIGAGPHTTGQVLVWHDFLGINQAKTARFVKRYADLGNDIKSAAQAFAREVAEGTYPGPEHTYE
jgi:3-methyl-2-oxobutanoate hydroxymethyltransferase